ncbi:MAG: exosortase [Isosphaeraceae bacterium]
MNAVASLTASRDGGSRPVPWSPNLGNVLAMLLVSAALGTAYAPNFSHLVAQWNRDPNYSYGFFVIPIAALIFWTRRGMIDRTKLAPRWWGFAPLLTVLALRFPLYESNEQYVETATIPLAIAALALALGGRHLLRVALPSVVFLFFMLPLPPSLNTLLARPLQTVATIGSVALLQIMGMPVLAEGNVIVIGETPLEVARACNGLSMLLSFVTLIAATVILVQRPIWERLLLMSSAIPIALISNIVRIVATAVCYHRLGQEAGEKIAHDLAGYAMMPIALLLVWLELSLMSWLFVEVEDVDPNRLFRRGGGRRPGIR